VGDALGAPTEGWASVPASHLDALERPERLTYTDDTAMTIGVGRSLVECEGFDGEHMAESLATIYGREPWRGYGAGPPLVFARHRLGVPWDEAAASLFGGEGSYGNGAAMRVAPVALFTYPDTDRAAELAAKTAIITHTHPEAIDGAVIQAVATTTLLATTDPVDPSQVIRLLIGYVQTPVFQNKLRFVDRHIGDRPLTEQADVLGTGIAAHASVITALASFLTHPESFSDAVKAAISLGGDTDTIAAMTGALAGAHLGAEAIPAAWQNVEGADELTTLASHLYERHRS
jgi:poly(ADP-ribose) glycohydrolase ARH3